MFEEVSCAIRPVCLCSAASIDPYTDSRSLSPWGVFCRNLTSMSASESIEYSSQSYSESVAQCCALCLCSVANWRRKRPGQAIVHALLDLLDGITATQTPLEVERKVPGRHVCARERRVEV